MLNHINHVYQKVSELAYSLKSPFPYKCFNYKNNIKLKSQRNLFHKKFLTIYNKK